MVHFDDEFAQSNAQFALLIVVLVDQSNLIVNTIKHTTHNAHMKYSPIVQFQACSNQFLENAYFMHPRTWHAYLS